MLQLDQLKLSNKKIKTILHDSEKSTASVNLLCMYGNKSGINRIKKRKHFIYISEKKHIEDQKSLGRIKKLIIPPAWQNLWICEARNGHLQATGIDIKLRKQYKYHTLWNSLRNNTKFCRLHQFGNSIAAIRRKIEKYLALSGLLLQKVLAAVVCIMERMSTRVANSMHEKLYGSFWLRTFKDQHIKITRNNMQFSFVGKKRVPHKISLASKRLEKIVQEGQWISTPYY